MSKYSFQERKDAFFVLSGGFFRNEINMQNAIEFKK